MAKRYTAKTLSIFWHAALVYRGRFFLLLSGVIGGAILGALIPVFYKRLFDTLSSGAPTPALVQDLFSTLVILLFVEIAMWACWRVATFTNSVFQPYVMSDLSNECFAYIHRHSFTFFHDNFVGSLVKKVRWFSKSFESIADRIFWNLLPLVINIVVICSVLFWRNWVLGAGVLIWIVVFLSINMAFTLYKMRYDVQRSEAETEVTGYLADTVTNFGTVKLFNGYVRERLGFSAINERVRRLRTFTWNLDNTFEAVQGFAMICLEIGMFYVAVQLWQRGLITVGDFVLLQAYFVNLFNRVWDFGKVVRGFYQDLADAEEMTAILETPHEIRDTHDAATLIADTGKIEFRDVDFYYHQTRPILKKFSLLITPHEHIALIGPSGAGKSTVIKLLLRQHDLSGGKILIDDQTIAHVTQESLWQAISLVPQDPVLFHRTLMENIRYGRPDATDDEVFAAARAAHCHEFIERLPEKYLSFVGERGVKLSGGERQRVAIARAILRNSPILILDEATSSLDSESEMLIQDALDTLMKGKTVIVIAHRLSTIRKMDRIIVVDEGKIIEEGKHDELMKRRGGLYKRLWQLQAGGFIAE